MSLMALFLKSTQFRTLSENGFNFLKRREGLKLLMYRDQGGKPTIGFGHLLTPQERASGTVKINGAAVVWTQGITEPQATILLIQDVAYVAKLVSSQVQVPVSQNQFDALVAFAFNVGDEEFANSTLLKKLNAKDYGAVPDQLYRWIYETKNGQKVISLGLYNRRKAEVQLWNQQSTGA